MLFFLTLMSWAVTRTKEWFIGSIPFFNKFSMQISKHLNILFDPKSCMHTSYVDESTTCKGLTGLRHLKI